MQNVLSTTLDFADVASGWRGLLDGSLKLSAKQTPIVAAGTGIWRDLPSFTGMTRSEMDDALTNGYSVAGERLAGSKHRRKRRNFFSEEEGEIQMDRLMACEDAFLLNREPRKRQRGVKLEVELAVRAETPASVLTDYALWLSKLISSLEDSGFQTQIDVVSRCRALTSAARQVDTHIRVKQFGTRGSRKTWGALFSPGGFRHLVFAARVLACERLGIQGKPGFGASFGPEWDLSFDPKQRRLIVKCAAMTSRFPVEEMDRKLAQIKF